MSFGMKLRINELKGLSWHELIVVVIVTLVLIFFTYSFIWWMVTLLLGIPFAWNHAGVFCIICMACGGVDFRWEGV